MIILQQFFALFSLSGEKQISGAFYDGVFTDLSWCQRGLGQSVKLWVIMIIAIVK